MNPGTDFALVREKLDQAVEILREKDLDLWLTFVRETSQTKDPCVPLIVGVELTWQSALLISSTGERVAIVGRYDADNVTLTGGYTTVIGYDESYGDLLLEQIDQFNPRSICLNFSESDPAADGLTHGMFRSLASTLAGTEYASRLISAEQAIAALRGRKSPSEIEHIQVAVRSTERILEEVRQIAKPGLTEREIASFVHERMTNRGLGAAWGLDHCPVVCAGPDAPFGHRMPGEIEIKPGSLMQIDFGVMQESFVADLQRTMYFLDQGEKEPPEEVQRAWDAARGALEAGRTALKPGVRGWEVDAAARSALVNAGYPEYKHAFGHHIGRSAHDGATVLGPKWERYGASVDGVIESGNVFAIELGVYVPGYGYIGREENVVVTSGGAEYLSDVQNELWVVRG